MDFVKRIGKGEVVLEGNKVCLVDNSIPKSQYVLVQLVEKETGSNQDWSQEYLGKGRAASSEWVNSCQIVKLMLRNSMFAGKRISGKTSRSSG